mmetsp:Transcript_14010/g.28730  ORF Transcript_14010/g.28730 Transcript_14010/m.28730 type:complete len:87 (+) Transcript_14010:1072-1332(+)
MSVSQVSTPLTTELMGTSIVKMEGELKALLGFAHANHATPALVELNVLPVLQDMAELTVHLISAKLLLTQWTMGLMETSTVSMEEL